MPTSEGIEKTFLNGEKIEEIPFNDIGIESSSRLRESQGVVFKSGRSEPQAKRYTARNAVSKSEAGVLLKASKDVEDTNQNILEEKHIELLTKLQDLRKEFHNSSDKKVYSNLQSLLNNLKDYYSKDRSQMNLNDDVSLLSNKKLEDLILKDSNTFCVSYH
ncbi:hypothetical protein BY996DRAFT_7390510 [Phakopsora pachyrhizi]|nr:hypothetical protein BY996DRAFT_8212501 [Phakopsora pachyrhizi]KAI8450323.1 hypothetical protein BY996DRAFT_7390510 [Phakopsora pachyrhizi]